VSDKPEEISEKIVKDIFEIASEQRLSILLKLNEKKSKLGIMANELRATAPEVKRNFDRLLKAKMIEKDTDGNFHLTLYGKTICTQIPSLVFLSDNKKFFEEHDFGDIPIKFIQRLGALQKREHIKGFVKVLEKWKLIHVNASKYIYNILAEVPYLQDIIDAVSSQLENNVTIHSIISEEAIIPDERKATFEKKEFQKFVKDGLLKRRMKKSVSVVVLLNDKECGIIFPNKNKKSDMSSMFYSSDPLFHDWCIDYFNHCWNNSSTRMPCRHFQKWQAIPPLAKAAKQHRPGTMRFQV